MAGIRRSLAFVGLFALVTSGPCALQAAEPPDLMQGIFQAVKAGDAERCVAALAQAEREKIWSFGGGVGPLDGDALLLRNLRMSAAVVLGKERQIAPAIVRKRADASEQSLVDALAVEPTDAEGVVVLLRHRSPAYRWLGLTKAEAGRLGGNPEVLEAVRRIAAADRHVIIGRALPPTPGPGQPPLPPGTQGSDQFVALVRDEAMRVLAVWGKEPPEVESLAQAGIAMLLFHYRGHRFDVLEAIFRLDHASPIRKTIAGLDPLKAGDDKAAITEFIAALKRDMRVRPPEAKPVPRPVPSAEPQDAPARLKAAIAAVEQGKGTVASLRRLADPGAIPFLEGWREKRPERGFEIDIALIALGASEARKRLLADLDAGDQEQQEAAVDILVAAGDPWSRAELGKLAAAPLGKERPRSAELAAYATAQLARSATPDPAAGDTPAAEGDHQGLIALGKTRRPEAIAALRAHRTKHPDDEYAVSIALIHAGDERERRDLLAAFAQADEVRQERSLDVLAAVGDAWSLDQIFALVARGVQTPGAEQSLAIAQSAAFRLARIIPQPPVDADRRPTVADLSTWLAWRAAHPGQP